MSRIAVILEINSTNIKAGIVGKTLPEIVVPIKYSVNEEESYPQYINNHALTNNQKQDIIDSAKRNNPKYKQMLRIYQQSRGSWLDLENIDESYLTKILHNIWLENLLISPRQTKVVLIDFEFSINLKQQLCKVLLENLRIKSLVFVPSTILSVLGSNRRNGLVLDFNWNSLQICSVVDLREIYRQQEISLSGEMLHFDTVLKLLESMNDVDIDFDFDSIENLIYHSEVSFNMNRVLELIDNLLQKSDIDNRNLLLENIIITGSVSNIANFKQKLAELITTQYPQARVIPTVGCWTACSLYTFSINPEFEEITNKSMISI